jgi:hypothetical protein
MGMGSQQGMAGWGMMAPNRRAVGDFDAAKLCSADA